MRRRSPLPPAKDGEEAKPRLTSLTKVGPGSFPVPVVPWGVLLARRRVAAKAQAQDGFARIALAIVLTAMFMVNLSVTAITVAVPRIAADFDAPQSTIIWAVTGPILVSAVLGPTFGKLGDQRGHRTIFLAGLVVNAAFTVLIATSWSAGSFVIFRLLAAVGGAAIGPAALAFINRLFAPRERASALGWWSFVGAGSPVIGVVLGGYVIDAIGWRWVFIGQAPLVLLAAILAGFILPQTTKQASASFDLPGAATLGVGVGSVLLAVTFAGEGLLSARVVGFAIVAIVALLLFARIERTSADPLIPPHYWRLRGFLSPTVTLTLLFAAYMGSFVLTPLMLQSAAFGVSAALTSRVIIARPLCFSLTGPIAGRLAEPLGERTLASFGGVSVTVSMIMLSRFEPGWSLWVMAVALGLAGIGMGAAAPVLTAAVANAVADEDLGIAGAAQQMLQQVGLVVGVQGLLAVQASIEDSSTGSIDDVVSSYHGAFVAAAVLAVGGTAAALTLPKSQVTPLQ